MHGMVNITRNPKRYDIELRRPNREHSQLRLQAGLAQTQFATAPRAHFRTPPDPRHNRRVAPLGELSV
jgi:hypothetical protein